MKFRRRGEKIAQIHSTKPRLQPKLLNEANTLLLPYCHIRAEQRSSLIVDRLQSFSESLVHLMALALVLVLVLAPNQVLGSSSFALLRQRMLQVIPTTSKVLLKRRKLAPSPLVHPNVLSRFTFLSPCTCALNSAGSVVL